MLPTFRPDSAWRDASTISASGRVDQRDERAVVQGLPDELEIILPKTRDRELHPAAAVRQAQQSQRDVLHARPQLGGAVDATRLQQWLAGAE